MRAPGSGCSGTDSKPAGQLGLAGGRERRSLLVPDADPFDLAAADGVGEGIKQIPDQPKNMFDADLFRKAYRPGCRPPFVTFAPPVVAINGKRSRLAVSRSPRR